MLISVAALCAGTLVMAMASNMAVAKDLPANRKLHTIFNNDTNNILAAVDPKKTPK